MGKLKDRHLREEEKERIKGMGNPYAYLSLEDDTEEQTLVAENRHRQYLRILENPYAYLTKFQDGGEQASLEVGEEKGVLPKLKGLKLPKNTFKSGCRSIFSQYISPEDGGTLRQEHRDFITHNESRSPEERYMLLEELKKYDLSSTGSYQPHFNRESGVLTKKKLTEIERKVFGDRR